MKMADRIFRMRMECVFEILRFQFSENVRQRVKIGVDDRLELTI